MTQHTLKSITRRTRAAVSHARKLFAAANESPVSLDQLCLKALRRLCKVEDDVRFLQRYEQDGTEEKRIDPL